MIVIIDIITNNHLEVDLLRTANNANIPKENSIAAIRTAITGSTALTYPEKMNVIAKKKRHKFTMIFLILLTKFDNAEH